MNKVYFVRSCGEVFQDVRTMDGKKPEHRMCVPAKPHRMIAQIISHFSIIILSCFLTACGFRLQGTQTLPPQLQQVYVNSSQVPHSAITPELTVALENNHITCVEDANQANIILNILQDNQTSHQIGSGASQETRKYELTYTVVFTLLNQAGLVIYGPATVTSTNIHYVYSGQVLGNNQEEGTLYQSLRRNVIQKILFKLGSDDVKTALTKTTKQTQGQANTKSVPTS